MAHLLYNFQYKGAPLTYSKARYLFQPRDAIVFYKASNEAFAYLEICFECEQFVAFPKWFQTEDFCNQKFTLLKSFFRQAGIHYGLQPPYDRDEVLVFQEGS